MSPYAAPWTPEQGEHYRLEMHRHAEEKADLLAVIQAIHRELEGDSDWTLSRWGTAVGKALRLADEALRQSGART